MTVARRIKRHGFTLVELLVVIIVIGILAAMMMFASDEIVSSAQAARILSNLTNWKRAAVSWYTDHLSVVLYNGMIDRNYRENKTSEPSAFREDHGASGYGVIKAKDILPYLSMSGLTLTPDGKVVDGYGGQYLTDYATANEFGTRASNDNYVVGNKDEYVWMIDYHLPNMSDKVKEKLQRKYVDSGLLHWKYPSKSMQYSIEQSKGYNSVGILVLDFRIKNKTMD